MDPLVKPRCLRLVAEPLLGDGQVVVDGPARQVMSESLVFASQINKLFRDPDLLTVEDVLGLQTPTSHAIMGSSTGGTVGIG